MTIQAGLRRFAMVGALAALAVGPGVAATPAAAGAKAPTCSGEMRPGRIVIVRGMPEATKATARAILRDAVRCNSKALITRAENDTTRLSFGIVTAKDFFALPDKDQKYRNLVDAMVKTRPGYEKITGSYIWPRVAAGDAYLDRTAWNEAVAAGLISRKEADRALRAGDGYLGWRVWVNADGNWDIFVAGD